jgi:hypothetical protein
MTSPDGITWTTRASAADNGWLSVTWAPELSIFVAVGSLGTGNLVMTSAIGMPNSKSVVKALPSQMTVLPSGNVGIAIAAPTEALHVNGNVKSTGLEVTGNVKSTGLEVTGNVKSTGLEVTGSTLLAAATLTGTLTTIAGTTTSAPLVVPAGALLTTAAVGSIESDSNVLYHTHTTGTTICRTFIDACQFFRRTTTSAAITTLSDVFNLSPYFKAGNFYEVEYYVVFTNTGAFIPNLAWFTTTGQPTLMYGDATVTPSNTTAAVSATTFNSTGSKQLASGNAAGTFLLRYRGVVVTVGNAFSPQMSVATSGSLTILPGSYYKVFNRGV